MTNVAMTIPYMFLSGAFASFNKKSEIVKPFEVCKNQKVASIATVIVTLTVGFANFFTIIEPAASGNYADTVWMIAGPVIFSLLAIIMYGNYEKKNVSKKDKAA